MERPSFQARDQRIAKKTAGAAPRWLSATDQDAAPPILCSTDEVNRAALNEPCVRRAFWKVPSDGHNKKAIGTAVGLKRTN